METTNSQKFKKSLWIIIPLFLALIYTLFYIFTGKSSQDLNTRVLESNQNVQKVEIKEGTSGDKTTQVECKNGSNYDVYYPPGSTNFEANAKSKCVEN